MKAADAESSAGAAEFLFLSSHRSLRAQGFAARISAPVADGRRGDRAFQQEVAAVLQRRCKFVSPAPTSAQ